MRISSNPYAQSNLIFFKQGRLQAYFAPVPTVGRGTMTQLLIFWVHPIYSLDQNLSQVSSSVSVAMARPYFGRTHEAT